MKRIISLCMFMLSLVPMRANVVFPEFTGWKLQEDQRIIQQQGSLGIN